MRFINNKIAVVFAVMLVVMFAGCASKATLQSLDELTAKQAIRDVLYQYTYNFDGKNPDQFVELFLPNAVWEIFPRGAEKPLFSFKGREDLKNFVANRFKTVLATRQTRHYITNTVFLELTADYARTQSTVLVVHKIKGKKLPVLINSGVYDDEFKKTKDGWKFASHTAM